MGWRDWPYWVKGAIILLAIETFIAICLFTYFAIMDYVIDPNGFGHGLAAGILVIFYLISIIPALIIGALIGWIYGKIKSK